MKCLSFPMGEAQTFCIGTCIKNLGSKNNLHFLLFNFKPYLFIYLFCHIYHQIAFIIKGECCCCLVFSALNLSSSLQDPISSLIPIFSPASSLIGSHWVVSPHFSVPISPLIFLFSCYSGEWSSPAGLWDPHSVSSLGLPHFLESRSS